MAMLTALLLISAQAAPVTIRCPVIQKLDPPRPVAKVQQPLPGEKGADAETLEVPERRVPARLRGTRVPRTQDEQPGFVADVVADDFRANAESSRKQMEAYSGLVGDAAKSVEQFTTDKPPRAAAIEPLRDPRCKDLSH